MRRLRATFRLASMWFVKIIADYLRKSCSNCCWQVVCYFQVVKDGFCLISDTLFRVYYVSNQEGGVGNYLKVSSYITILRKLRSIVK